MKLEVKILEEEKRVILETTRRPLPPTNRYHFLLLLPLSLDSPSTATTCYSCYFSADPDHDQLW